MNPRRTPICRNRKRGWHPIQLTGVHSYSHHTYCWSTPVYLIFDMYCTYYWTRTSICTYAELFLCWSDLSFSLTTKRQEPGRTNGVNTSRYAIQQPGTRTRVSGIRYQIESWLGFLSFIINIHRYINICLQLGEPWITAKNNIKTLKRSLKKSAKMCFKPMYSYSSTP